MITDCFIEESNGTLTSNLSASTIKFQQLYGDTLDCIGNFFNASSGSYNKGVCKNCTEKYCTLNKYYEKLKDSANGEMCMDIVDTVSIVRR